MITKAELLPIARKLNVLLADDDKADCLLFKEALEELQVSVKLTIVHDGEQLLKRLTRKGSKLPDVLFLDLNMPRKNGFASLGEIKRNDELQQIPVIIYSTANEQDKLKMVYRDAAHYYIRKPSEFSELKRVIYEALTLIAENKTSLPGEENFVLTGALKITSDEIKATQKKSS